MSASSSGAGILPASSGCQPVFVTRARCPAASGWKPAPLPSDIWRMRPCKKWQLADLAGVARVCLVYKGHPVKPALAPILTWKPGSFGLKNVWIGLIPLLAAGVLAFRAQGAVPPTITQQPQSLAVAVGEDATFTVTVTNTATMPINYQWRKGSIPLTNILLNATPCSLTLFNVQTNVTASNGPGSYRVAISNAATPIALVGSPLVSLAMIAATAPVALTDIATEIAGDGATLNGSVNPNGPTTWFQFKYGLTESYGNSTPLVKVGNGTNLLPVSAGTAGLIAAKTYHYQLVASNRAGMSAGADQTFTTTDTLLPPPLAAGLPAAAVALAPAVLNGTVNPNGGYAGVYFEYGPTTNYGNTAITNIVHGSEWVLVSTFLAGLSTETAYHWRVVAFNSSGATFGADQLFQTFPMPEAVTLPISRITINDLLLTGSVNPHGAEASVHFEYGGTTQYGSSTAPVDVGNGTEAILVSNLVARLPGYTNYHFRLVVVNAGGTVYGADETFLLDGAPPLNFTTLAGDAGGIGSVDGMGSAARFSGPTGVAVDGGGNVYVADSDNNTIRKITPTGMVSSLAGLAGQSGCVDGTGSAARFFAPVGLDVDRAGNVYVADGDFKLRKIPTTGEVSTLAGLPGSSGSADGTGSDARFAYPFDVAVDTTGNIFVADWYNYTIRKITSRGVVTTVAGLARTSGSTDGTGSDARFYEPNSVAVDTVGNLYLADFGNPTIRKISPGGVVSTLAGQAGRTGDADGSGTNA